MIETITIKTNKREEWMDITHQIQQVVDQKGAHSGAVQVFIPHTTAGVTINENADPDVQRDLTAGLNRMVPKNQGFLHSEGNSDAHLKASLMGPSCMVPIKDGQLYLGTWQGIYFAEFDGPRVRRAVINIMGV